MLSRVLGESRESCRRLGCSKRFVPNKLILVPSAFIISAFLPWLIPVLLVLGAIFMFEGVEKI